METFNTPDGSSYHYVSKIDRTVIEPRAVVDFGVRDAKGRAVGMLRRVDHEAVTLAEQKPAGGCAMLHRVGAPLARFVGTAISTRNGSAFGSATVSVWAQTPADCAAQLDARIERARKLAARKFTT
jgi:hypothetical protein